MDGNQVSGVKSAEYEDSYETFVKYMRIVFAYAGTLSMEAEAEEITYPLQTPEYTFLEGSLRRLNY